MSHMDVCVFGAGSLGCAVGGFLARTNKVTLVGRSAVVEAINRDGLRVFGDARFRTWPRAVESVEGLQPPGLVIVTTKAYDTREAVKSCARVADNDTLVLTLQNGLSNLRLLRGEFGSRAFGGTTTMGAFMRVPGSVKVSGLGRTVIGADADSRGARAIVRTFRRSGLMASATDNIEGEIWAKAIINASINPTAAVLRVPNGALVSDRTIARLIDAICEESVRVAAAEGVRLPTKDMTARVRAVCRATSENFSSMLQDILRGKRTEINEITGAICAHGARNNLATPLNSALLAMVSSLETKTRVAKG